MSRPRLSDRDLRLECARLVAVFSGGEGDQVEKTEKLFRFVRSDEQPFCPHCGYDLRQDEPVEIGAARFDPKTGFSFDGVAVALTVTERLVVSTLMRARGGWVAKETLGERMDSEVDGVRVYIKRVRQKIAAAGGEGLIQSAYGLGYRWAGAAESAAA